MSADPRITAPFAAAGAPLPELVWVPCATCWGQRILWHQTPEGLRPATCEGCSGIGEQLHRLVPA